MSKLLLMVAASIGLFLSSASAQDPEEELKVWNEKLVKREITRYVPSGKSRLVFFLGGADPDCSPWGSKTEVRTTKKPEHGTVKIVPGVAVMDFGKGSLIAHCTGKKMPVLDINYQSFPKYTGPDEFELLVMWPAEDRTAGSSHGRHSEMQFKMNVR
jgi:hypothetical protein